MSRGAEVILGISCDYHDAAAALLVDGELAAAAEEERFSRVKHDAGTPRAAVESCLRVAGVDARDVAAVAFYERPVDVLARFLAAHRRQGPVGYRSFLADLPRLVGPNLMVGYRIERVLRDLGARHEVELHYFDHHRSHAASAFFASPFRTSAILTVDGIGEWATASVARGVRGRIDMIEEQRYPHSLGLLYSFITAYCGFRPNADEYKVMGLAPFGEPRYLDALEQLAEVHPDGSMTLDGRRLRWFMPAALGDKRLHRLLDGPPATRGAYPTEREADLAASVQHLTEEVMLRLARHSLDVTGEQNLCLAGGVALNCVANGRIRDARIADELWIQPASGDAGGAVGAALALWHEVMGRERSEKPTDMMKGAFLGPRVQRREVGAWAEELRLRYVEFDDVDDLCEHVADRLAAGQIVGWFQGRMEFGPRALGHRSILADPRRSQARRDINARIKRREPFRPFAPAVLAEFAADWFDLDSPSPYMVQVAAVRDAHVPPEARHVDGTATTSLAERADLVTSPIPACTHVDGSARVQTVDAATNPEFHRLLAAFERRTGCPVLLNTSFNVAGEPIVATPEDALRTARESGLDLLVVESSVFEGPAWEA